MTPTAYKITKIISDVITFVIRAAGTFLQLFNLSLSEVGTLCKHGKNTAVIYHSIFNPIFRAKILR